VEEEAMAADTSLRERLRARVPGTLEIASSSFGHGQRIPTEHTLDGLNASPDLSWSPGPERTRSYALICEDPDAPTLKPYVHWVLFDIPAGVHELSEGIPKDGKPRELYGGLQGTNDFGHFGYDGPAPPPGHGTHHYRFQLYALDRILDLHAGCRKADVLRAMKGHVLAQGELIGTYHR
jgi:Raf kinase inhibitor-like YbhB/YbcL family protein